jgi:transcription elongation GreA/GreB family factor
MGKQDITLTDVDRSRLGTLLNCAETAAYVASRSRFDLETKIEEAEAIALAYAPRTLVTMNSTVVLVDVGSGERRTLRLVYPEGRELIPHSVGVFQRSGQCILGRRVGDIVQLTEGAGWRRFRIESIPYQPEAAGARHL